MQTHQPAVAKAPASFTPARSRLLQRKCACGGVPGLTGECTECAKKRMSPQRRASLAMQTKLTINQPGDEFEQEADRVADAVVSGRPVAFASSDHAPGVQRQPSPGEPGRLPPDAKWPLKKQKEPLMRREAGSLQNQSEAPPIVHEVLRSPGQPLDLATRAFMEQRFGHDFSQVRVHADVQAADSAQAVDALAYTAGPEVVFGAGQYSPWTTAGQRLLAHELAHVIQQSDDARTPRATQQVSQPDDPAEQSAENVADRVVGMFPTTSDSLLGKTLARGHPSKSGLLQRRAIRREYSTTETEHGPLCDVTLTITGAPESGSPSVSDFVDAAMDGIRSACGSLGGQARRQLRVTMPYRRGRDHGQISNQAYMAARVSVLGPSAVPPAVEQVREAATVADTPTPTPAQPAPTAPPIYLCSKNLDTSPLGKHAFFRIGGAAVGNPTYSLQPENRGGDCWQGQPLYNAPSDYSATGDCDLTSLSASCLQREFVSYPIGHYCTLGPNSNTFVGHLARRCGMAAPDPPGWTPGIDDRPPLSGTFAPSPESTLLNCTMKTCDASIDLPPDEIPV